MTDVVQVMLRDERNGRMTTNVSDRPDLKVGSWITLKNSEDPTKQWLVTWKAAASRPASSIPRGWGMTDI